MKKTVLIALGIMLFLSLWLLSGLVGDEAENIQPVAGEKTLASVRFMPIAAEQTQISLLLQGRTEARRIVDVAAEIAGKVVATPVEKGQRVKKGELLCQLAEEDRPARLSRAEASFDKARIDFEGAQKLFDDGLISSAAIAASKSELENARAQLKQAALQVDYLKMRAPFDAFVEDRPAQVGALIERNHVCARLLDESSLLATAQASEKDVQQLALGQAVSVRLAGGREMAGRISFIGRTADPVTRTYTIEAELVLNGEPLRDGISAEIEVPVRQLMAHRMSPALLAIDGDGKLGVRIVNDADVVEFYPVEVVNESQAGVWVTGLPQDRPLRLITVGQELAAPGEKVNAVSAEQILQQQGDLLQ